MRKKSTVFRGDFSSSLKSTKIVLGTFIFDCDSRHIASCVKEGKEKARPSSCGQCLLQLLVPLVFDDFENKRNGSASHLPRGGSEGSSTTLT